MSADQIVTTVVGGTVLLGVGWRLLRAIHKGVNLIEHLIDRVTQLEKTLGNGIRSDIREAAVQADKAAVLAAEAAKTAAVAQQLAVEGRHEVNAAISGLRAEIDVMTNVAMADHTHLWETLASAGLDRRTGDAG